MKIVEASNNKKVFIVTYYLDELIHRKIHYLWQQFQKNN